MESRDRAARDRDEGEGIDRAGNDRATAGDEGGRGRHLQRRVDDHHRQHEERDRADLHERAEIVARAEQQPHRQHRGHEPVRAHRHDELFARQLEVGPDGRCRDRLADDHRDQQPNHPDGRRLGDPALAEPVHVEAHEQRQGNRRADGERAPGALVEGVDDGQPEAGEGDDDDEEDGDGRGGARHRSDLLPGDLRQRAAAAPGRGPEHDEVVDRARPGRRPQTSQIRPGAQPNCAASTGPISGPAPVIAAK